jgi:hypothetical protein
MKTAFLTAVITTCIMLVSVLASITEEGGGIIYGEDHAFNLKAPKGWMFDNESAVQQGLHAVFYPKGSTWENSVVIAYARARSRTKEVATADDAAKAAIDDFHAKGNPQYEGKRVKTIKTKTGAEGVIYHFTGDRYGNYEAMVYFVEAKTINIVVLNSRDRKAFEAALPAFDELAASYIFLGDTPLKDSQPKATPARKKSAK